MSPKTVNKLTLRRRWVSYKYLRYPERILVLAKRNYKVYADIGITKSLIRRALPMLDREAGPNFIRRSELPLEMEHEI